MKKIILAVALLAAPVTLTGCASFLASPASVANQTKLDEQAAIGVNLAYKSFRLAVETAVEANIVVPGSPLALKIADLDNRAFSAVQAVDAAYKAGNSNDYATAVARAYVAIDAAVAALKGRSQ